jgi:predicted ATPase
MGAIQERLIIKNFLTIKQFDWDIKDFNILTGGMASGKSLCIKLVHFIEQVFHKNIFFASISKDSLTKEAFYSNIGEQFHSIFHSFNYQSDFGNTEISYTYSYINSNIPLFESSRGEKTTFDLNARWNTETNRLEWSSKYIDSRIDRWRDLFGNDNTPDTVQNARLQIYEKIAHDFSDNFPIGAMFIPASRAIAAITNTNIPDPFYLDFLLEYKPFVLNFKDISDNDVNKILHIKSIFIDRKSKKPDLNFELYDGRKITPLELSSGQQELVYLLLLIKNLPQTTFKFGETTSVFIEEPSAHLFPREQKEVIEYIVKIFRELQDKKARFFISTHSPYILNVLNNILKKGLILKKFKGQKDIINSKFIFPHLDSDEISALFINNDGTVRDMLDKENEYLNADQIAEISYCIDEDTAKLFDLNNELIEEEV